MGERIGMSSGLFETVMVPIADPDDARQTARAVRAHLDGDSTLIVTHVVPKGEGVPDKASVEQRERFAERSYEAFVDEIGGGVTEITPLTLYGREVAETIVDGAVDADATTIAFTPRGVSGWTKLLGKSITDRLIERSSVPVVVLPPPSENDETE